jgi:alkylation response protein AidB-like acyl-CoA dehydrogenase
MDIEISEEQLILGKAARDFLEKECPSSLVREMREGKILYEPQLWRNMADLGWLGLLFPSKYGGGDSSLSNFITLLSETGRALAPVPFPQTVLAGLAISQSDNEHLKSLLIPRIVSGKSIANIAVTEGDGDYNPMLISAQAQQIGNDYILSGSKHLIQFGPVLDLLIILARTSNSPEENGLTCFVIDCKESQLNFKENKSTTGIRQYQVILDGIRVSRNMILGEVGKGWQFISRILLFEAITKCSIALGSAEKVLEMTVDMAKTRVQFGRPIGTFQAVQQQCAGMLIDVDGMRYSTYNAASMMENGIPCTKEVAVARIFTDAAYKRVVASAVKIHGAIGFTREHDVGLHFLNSLDDELPFSHDDYYRKQIVNELNREYYLSTK